jgi:site-specific DNA-methyltransferase (adenine-specific)
MTLIQREFETGTLYLGDVSRVTELVAPGTVDLTLVDPPYCSGGSSLAAKQAPPSTKYVNSSAKVEYPEFAGDNLDQRGFLMWCARWIAASNRLLVDGGLHVQFTDWRQLPVTTDAIQVGGIMWRGILSWDKTEQARPRKGGFRAQAEFAVWGSKGQLRPEIGCLPGAFRVPVKIPDKQHITQKPTALLRQLVQAALAGGLVADWFMGSGTTAVAAIETGRRWIGCEVVPEIFDIACDRIREAQRARCNDFR